MTDVAVLSIGIQAHGADDTRNKLNDVHDASEKLERKAKEVSSAFQKMWDETKRFMDQFTQMQQIIAASAAAIGTLGFALYNFSETARQTIDNVFGYVQQLSQRLATIDIGKTLSEGFSRAETVVISLANRVTDLFSRLTSSGMAGFGFGSGGGLAGASQDQFLRDFETLGERISFKLGSAIGQAFDYVAPRISEAVAKAFTIIGQTNPAQFVAAMTTPLMATLQQALSSINSSSSMAAVRDVGAAGMAGYRWETNGLQGMSAEGLAGVLNKYGDTIAFKIGSTFGEASNKIAALVERLTGTTVGGVATAAGGLATGMMANPTIQAATTTIADSVKSLVATIQPMMAPIMRVAGRVGGGALAVSMYGDSPDEMINLGLVGGAAGAYGAAAPALANGAARLGYAGVGAAIGASGAAARGGLALAGAALNPYFAYQIAESGMGTPALLGWAGMEAGSMLAPGLAGQALAMGAGGARMMMGGPAGMAMLAAYEGGRYLINRANPILGETRDSFNVANDNIDTFSELNDAVRYSGGHAMSAILSQTVSNAIDIKPDQSIAVLERLHQAIDGVTSSGMHAANQLKAIGVNTAESGGNALKLFDQMKEKLDKLTPNEQTSFLRSFGISDNETIMNILQSDSLKDSGVNMNGREYVALQLSKQIQANKDLADEINDAKSKSSIVNAPLNAMMSGQFGTALRFASTGKFNMSQEDYDSEIEQIQKEAEDKLAKSDQGMLRILKQQHDAYQGIKNQIDDWKDEPTTFMGSLGRNILTSYEKFSADLNAWVQENVSGKIDIRPAMDGLMAAVIDAWESIKSGFSRIADYIANSKFGKELTKAMENVPATGSDPHTAESSQPSAPTTLSAAEQALAEQQRIQGERNMDAIMEAMAGISSSDIPVSAGVTPKSPAAKEFLDAVQSSRLGNDASEDTRKFNEAEKAFADAKNVVAGEQTIEQYKTLKDAANLAATDLGKLEGALSSLMAAIKLNKDAAGVQTDDSKRDQLLAHAKEGEALVPKAQAAIAHGKLVKKSADDALERFTSGNKHGGGQSGESWLESLEERIAAMSSGEGSYDLRRAQMYSAYKKRFKGKEDEDQFNDIMTRYEDAEYKFGVVRNEDKKIEALKRLTDAYNSGLTPAIEAAEKANKVANLDARTSMRFHEQNIELVNKETAAVKANNAAKLTYNEQMQVEGAQLDTNTIGLTGASLANQKAQNRITMQAKKDGLTEEQVANARAYASAAADIAEKTAEANKMAAQMNDTVLQGATDIVTHTKSWNTALKDVLHSFEQIIVKQELTSLYNSFTGGGSIFGGVSGVLTGATSVSNALGFVGSGSGGSPQFSNMPGSAAAGGVGALALGGGGGAASGSGGTSIYSIGGMAVSAAPSTFRSIMSGDISGAYSGSVLQDIFGGGTRVSTFGGSTQAISDSTQLVRLSNGTIVTGDQYSAAMASNPSSEALANAQGIGTAADNGGIGAISSYLSAGKSAYSIFNGIDSGVASLNTWGYENLGIGNASMASSGYGVGTGAEAAYGLDTSASGGGSSLGLGNIGMGVGGAFSLGMGINSLVNSNGSAGSIVGGVGQVVGGGMMMASLLPGLSALGPWGMGAAAVGMLIGSLFGGGSEHGPSGQAWFASGGSTGKSIPLGGGASYSAAGLADAKELIGITSADQLNPNRVYAGNGGGAHGGNGVGETTMLSAFTDNLNAMIEQYNLKIDKQFSGLLIGGDNSNPGFGSTDAIMLALANKKIFTGQGEVGKLFQRGGWSDVKTLQSALQVASSVDDMGKKVLNLNNPFYDQYKSLEDNYVSQKTSAEKYNISTENIDAMHAAQLKRLQEDEGLSNLQASDSMSARLAKLSGNLVEATRATTEASQAAEYLNAQRQGNVEMEKLAAAQAKEFSNAIAVAGATMKKESDAITAQAMAMVGQGSQAALLGVNDNLAISLAQAQASGQDMSRVTPVLQAQASAQAMSAVAGLIDQKISSLSGKIGQSQGLRDTVTSMELARMTPQELYTHNLDTFRTDLGLAKGGNLLALQRLASEGSAAVSAEKSYTGGTGKAVYDEVTAGLTDMADQIDKANGINADQAKQQLNELMVIKQNTANLADSFSESTSSLEQTMATVTAAYTTNLTFLQSLAGSFSGWISSAQDIVTKAQQVANQQASAASTTSSSTAAVQKVQADAVATLATIKKDATTYTTVTTALDNAYSAALRNQSTLTALLDWTANTSEGSHSSKLDQINWLAQNKMLPGFAKGGDFMGGLRIVGERGPELEATGASRIWDSNTTVKMLSAANGNSVEMLSVMQGLRAEVASLRAEVAMLRQTTVQGAVAIRDAVEDGNASTRTIATATARTASRPQAVRAA